MTFSREQWASLAAMHREWGEVERVRGYHRDAVSSRLWKVGWTASTLGVSRDLAERMVPAIPDLVEP